MTAYLSWNSFVTENNKMLHKTVALSWLFITSITKESLLQEPESVISLDRSKFKLCKSFENDLLAMPVRPWRQ